MSTIQTTRKGPDKAAHAATRPPTQQAANSLASKSTAHHLSIEAAHDAAIPTASAIAVESTQCSTFKISFDST
jgi:hypothetical protein